MTITSEDIERFARSVALSLKAINAERTGDIDELREEVAALGTIVDALRHEVSALGARSDRLERGTLR